MAMTARQIKPVVFILALLPLASIAAALWLDRLGANPVEAIIRGTGDWTLRLLLITLAVSPVRRLLGWRWAPGLRRMLGLFVWFYASLHLLSYLWLDQFFDWQEIFYDILERPFITVGVLGWLLLTTLALTSTTAAMRRLGTNWKRLHRLVYLIAILGVLHFWWLVKADVREPFIYMAILALLFAERIRHGVRRKASAGKGSSLQPKVC